MGVMIPNSKPKLLQSEAKDLIQDFNLGEYPVKLLGIRGYYKQTMGNPIKNDRGIYDDAIFILSPELFGTYNANTDPSVAKPGVAVLKPGVYLYKIGLHGISRPNPYKALRQYGRVTVYRDGRAGEFTDTKQAPFYINIHRGGINTTSSLGCQTIHPSQWPSFIATVEDQLKRFNQPVIPYALIEA